MMKNECVTKDPWHYMPHGDSWFDFSTSEKQKTLSNKNTHQLITWREIGQSFNLATILCLILQQAFSSYAQLFFLAPVQISNDRLWEALMNSSTTGKSAYLKSHLQRQEIAVSNRNQRQFPRFGLALWRWNGWNLDASHQIDGWILRISQLQKEKKSAWSQGTFLYEIILMASGIKFWGEAKWIGSRSLHFVPMEIPGNSHFLWGHKMWIIEKFENSIVFNAYVNLMPVLAWRAKWNGR